MDEKQEEKLAMPRRRSNISEEQVSKWKALEEQGMKRSAIAKQEGYDPSVITRHLGTRKKEEQAA